MSQTSKVIFSTEMNISIYVFKIYCWFSQLRCWLFVLLLLQSTKEWRDISNPVILVNMMQTVCIPVVAVNQILVIVLTTVYPVDCLYSCFCSQPEWWHVNNHVVLVNYDVDCLYSCCLSQPESNLLWECNVDCLYSCCLSQPESTVCLLTSASETCKCTNSAGKCHCQQWKILQGSEHIPGSDT